MIPSIETIFRSYLATGEEILWTARAGTRRRWVANDVIEISILIFYTGFASVMAFGGFFGIIGFFGKQVPENESGCFSIFVSLFMLLCFIFGSNKLFQKLYLEKKILKNTTYALTDIRVLILRGPHEDELEIENINLNTIQELILCEYPDGLGTIEIVDTRSMVTEDRDSAGVKKKKKLPAFESIPDVTKVYQLIDESMERMKKAAVKF